MSKTRIRIGTRGSKLALWQSNWVKEQLEKHHGNLDIDLEIIKTKGDKILDSPLSEIGDKGLFTKEIEKALLDEKVDFAVHSLKDLPTEITEGLKIGAIVERQSVHDVLISSSGFELHELNQGARIGTSSLRRRAQLLHYRPDFEIVDLRGNLDTRLRKLDELGLEGIILAKAGVIRLGEWRRISQTISTDIILPAVGQGALAIEIRENDDKSGGIISFLDHKPTRHSVTSERGLLRFLEGGCQVPIGAYGKIEAGKLVLVGLVASLDGKVLIRDRISGKPEDAEALGRKLGKILFNRGADKILESIRSSEALT